MDFEEPYICVNDSSGAFNLNVWHLGPTIATTRNSVIRTGTAYQNGCPTAVAVKSAPTSRALSLQKEKGILRALRGSPEIIRCHFANVSSSSVSFSPNADDDNNNYNDDEDTYHLFLELSPCGSLADLIAGRGPLPEAQIRSYTESLLLGLDWIHSNGYVHCDINPGNILVWGEEDVKIADFGSAKRAGEVVRGRRRGTEGYLAPESVERGEYEEVADVWGLGCVVAEMAGGRSWAMGVETRAVHGLSEVGRDFVGKCLLRDPEERWTVEMLLDHPFVSDGDQDGLEEVEEEMVVDLELRLGLPFGVGRNIRYR